MRSPAPVVFVPLCAILLAPMPLLAQSTLFLRLTPELSRVSVEHVKTVTIGGGSSSSASSASDLAQAAHLTAGVRRRLPGDWLLGAEFEGTAFVRRVIEGTIQPTPNDSERQRPRCLAGQLGPPRPVRHRPQPLGGASVRYRRRARLRLRRTAPDVERVRHRLGQSHKRGVRRRPRQVYDHAVERGRRRHPGRSVADRHPGTLLAFPPRLDRLRRLVQPRLPVQHQQDVGLGWGRGGRLTAPNQGSSAGFARSATAAMASSFSVISGSNSSSGRCCAS